MDELVFEGNVVNGRGTHVELGVPGRALLQNAPPDWPEQLTPGSLNLQVTRYPEAFATRGLAASVDVLDRAGFRPEFVITRDQMQNNQLRPTPGMPHRGDAQVSRAELEVSGRTASCWVLRRFGSGLTREIELVAGVNLRSHLGLSKERDWPARVRMFGTWA